MYTSWGGNLVCMEMLLLYLMGSKFYQFTSITVQETQAFSEAWNLAQCILNSILRDYGRHKCAV